MPLFTTSLLIAIVIAVYCGLDAGRRRQQAGSTPWNLSSGVWGVIGFFLGVIGLVLYLVARSQHDRQLRGDRD